MIYIVAGLGFGDEGKGSIVDALVRQQKAFLVVRYNGGSQAAHHVVTDKGESHCFSQFGSGTLAGALTYLSEHVTIDPPAIFKEAAHLKELGVTNPLSMLLVSPDCPVVTPYHKALNRLREISRGAGKHGSCGMGVGEVMRDIIHHPLEVIRAKHLHKPDQLREMVDAIQARLIRMVESLPFRLDNDIDKGFNSWLMINRSPAEWIAKCREFWLDTFPIVPASDNYVFEGAQGVLLDELHGFHPYTTWSNTTFNNALDLILRKTKVKMSDVVRIGVTRAYHTRHGAGPFPTEIKSLSSFANNDHNKHGDWQGAFRVGYLDIPLLKYACEVAQPQIIAVTHMDEVGRYANIGYEYLLPDGRLTNTIHKRNQINHVDGVPSDLTQWLQAVKPIYRHSNHEGPFATVDDMIEQLTNIPVGMTSWGPKANDKTELTLTKDYVPRS